MKYTNTKQALQGAPRWAAQWHISGSSSPSAASPTPGKKDPSHREVAGVEGARNKRQGGGDKQRTAAIGGLNHGSGCLLLGGCGQSLPTQVGGGRINDGAALWMRPLGIWDAQPDDIRPLNLAHHSAIGEKLDVGAAFFGNVATVCVLANQHGRNVQVDGQPRSTAPLDVQPLPEGDGAHGCDSSLELRLKASEKLPNLLRHANSNLLLNQSMLTISETRRLRLLQILQERSLTPAELSDRLGRSRTDGTLNQIINRYKQSKTGTVRGMGTNQARRIEQVLGLPLGWMDSPIEPPPARRVRAFLRPAAAN